MPKVTITKDEPLLIVVETLENYPVEVTWEDAFQVAVNKMNADQQKRNMDRANAQAKAAAEAVQASQATKVSPPASNAA